MRRLTLPVLVLLGGALLVGCSDDEPASDSGSSSSASSASDTASSSASAGTPAVCDSLDQLQTSLAALTKVPVAEGGIEAVRTAFSTVQADAKQVVDDAQDQYADRSDQLSTDVSAVQSAVDDAVSDPGSATLQAVGSAISTLSSDVTAFAGDVGSTC